MPALSAILLTSSEPRSFRLSTWPRYLFLRKLNFNYKFPIQTLRFHHCWLVVVDLAHLESRRWQIGRLRRCAKLPHKRSPCRRFFHCLSNTTSDIPVTLTVLVQPFHYHCTHFLQLSIYFVPRLFPYNTEFVGAFLGSGIIWDVSSNVSNLDYAV